MRHQFDLNADNLIQGLSDTLNEDLERGLDKAAARAMEALRDASPRGELADSGEKPYRDSWYVKDRYKKVRYITNDKYVDGPDGPIPLKMLLEYGTEEMPAQPHIQKTYDAIEDELAEIILGEINLDL
ncbi:HK97-gp10 family putative phage morphogenesis protein [Merdimmobilis hominis]|uniref:HK97 gp10 family phage protein n=1 Tax=Merdimmobilis hominis TaxID=2897707 RepID=UPI0008F834E4|nr:HK97 gp10 family phage protein [Merdimmobilis hominis]